MAQQTIEQQFKSEILIQGWTVPAGLHTKLAGAPSFYYAVTRLPQYNPQYGYYYKIYFFSGSYYHNGAWAGTYLEDVAVYIDGQFLFGGRWAMFQSTYTNQVFHFTLKLILHSSF